jgi:hypothetical protein
MDKKELLKSVAELAKTAGTTPGGKSAFAEMLVQLIEPEFLSLDIFNAFMPTRQVNVGDPTIRRLRRGKYSVQSMVAGTQHLVSQPTTVSDFHSFVFDQLIGGVRESLMNVQEGSHITVDMMRKQLQNDIIETLVARVFNLLTSTWTSAATPSHYVQTNKIKYTELDELIENVMYTAGDVKAIVGVRRAIRPIYEFSGFREYSYVGGGSNIAYPVPEKLIEFLNTNRVTTYKGIPIIETPQVFRNQLPTPREALLPEDQILVIGQNAGEILLYGNVEYQEHTDTTIQPADYVLHAWQKYGLVVDMPENIGVIKVV